MGSTVTLEFAGLFDSLTTTFTETQDNLVAMYPMGSEGSVWGKTLWWGNQAGLYYDAWETNGLVRLNTDLEAIHTSISNARTDAANFYTGDNNPEAAASLPIVPALEVIPSLAVSDRPTLEPPEIDQIAEDNATTLRNFINSDVLPNLDALKTDGEAALAEVHTADADTDAEHWSDTLMPEITSLETLITELYDAVIDAITALKGAGGGYGSRH